eukprot:1729869-Rhodomonas_salina.1
MWGARDRSGAVHDAGVCVKVFVDGCVAGWRPERVCGWMWRGRDRSNAVDDAVVCVCVWGRDRSGAVDDAVVCLCV